MNVTQVTWRNGRTGGTGSAVGTNNWGVNNITLGSGNNPITVTAHDAAGNTSTDAINVSLVAFVTSCSDYAVNLIGTDFTTGVHHCLSRRYAVAGPTSIENNSSVFIAAPEFHVNTGFNVQIGSSFRFQSTGKFIGLNDTGQILCANEQANNLACPEAGFPGQDAEFGRDKTDNNNSDGLAGFNFSKLDSFGNPLLSTANDWRCVKDNVTGLIWEVKTQVSEFKMMKSGSICPITHTPIAS